MSSIEERLARLTPRQRELFSLRLDGIRTATVRRSGRAAEDAPLSLLQRRLWLADQLDPGSPAYHVRSASRVRGPLDVGLLTRALHEVAQRHDALRTSIRLGQDGPRQVVSDRPVVRMRTEQAHEVTLDAQITAEVRAPFRLADGPLWRVALFVLAPADHVLVVTLHHVVADGRSAAVLEREMTTLYAAWRRTPDADARALLPVLHADHRLYARWQRDWLSAPEAPRGLARCVARLADAPRQELPGTAGRGGRWRPATGRRYPFLLDPSVVAEIRSVARSANATMFMVLLAAYSVVLAAQGTERDLVVGAPATHRPRPEFEPLVGCFVNTLALRLDLTDDPSMDELLHRAVRASLDAFDDAAVAFEDVVRALDRSNEMGRRPLFQAVLGWQRTTDRVAAVADLTVSRHEVDSGTAQFPLALDVIEAGREVVGAWEYDREVFDEDTIAGLHADLLTVLAALAAAPARRVEEVCADLQRRAMRRRRDRADDVRMANREKLRRRAGARRANTPTATRRDER